MERESFKSLEEVETKEKEEILPLAKILNKPEIRAILKMEEKRKNENKEVLTKNDLTELEQVLGETKFSFGPEDWLSMWKTIKNHPDFLYLYPEGFKKDALTIESNKMENIYSEFPRLLLTLYFKNKTGIDFRERELVKILLLKDEPKTEKLKQYSPEKIKEFEKEVKNFNEKIKKIRKNIQLMKKKNKEYNIEMKNATERIANSFTEFSLINIKR